MDRKCLLHFHQFVDCLSVPDHVLHFVAVDVVEVELVVHPPDAFQYQSVEVHAVPEEVM